MFVSLLNIKPKTVNEFVAWLTNIWSNKVSVQVNHLDCFNKEKMAASKTGVIPVVKFLKHSYTISCEFKLVNEAIINVLVQLSITFLLVRMVKLAKIKHWISNINRLLYQEWGDIILWLMILMSCYYLILCSVMYLGINVTLFVVLMVVLAAIKHWKPSITSLLYQ